MYRLKSAVFIVFISLMLVACSSSTTPEETQAPPRTIKVQLDWIHTVEYAGLYMAEANGYFAEENLAVELIPNDGSIRGLEVLNNGEVDFALTGADTLLLARETGQDAVAIATIYQRLPLAFMSLGESNILVPADMEGKTVMMTLNRTSEYAFRAMMQVAGVDISTITIVPREVYDESPLTNGDVDAIDVFVTNQVVQMQRAGVDINIILPVDYGVEMYVNTVVTLQSTIDTDSELVQAFTRALTRGLEAAIADPAAATSATVAMNPDLNYESELESMNSSLPFLNPSGSNPGMMTASTWQFIYEMLRNQNILTEDQSIEEAYSLQFLDVIYAD